MHLELGGSRLYDLQRLGQSVWLECNHLRTLGHSTLVRFIRDGISGIDASPTGLVAAYADDAARIEDLRHAAELLRRVYNHTGGGDGYVNVDLAPSLADDAEGTVSEARRVWSEIDRPNVMIKVPATAAGSVAIRRCIAAGLNVNATRVFGTRRYQDVAEAYLSGLEDRLADRLPLERVVSVASILVNRIDIAVDAELDAVAQPDKATHAQRLHGKAAVAVSQFLYQRYRSLIASPRWRVLAANHAKPQRLLWAGTDVNGTHDNDLKYVNQLVGPNTVTAMSLSTLGAYLNHGAAAPTLKHDLLHVLELFGEFEAVGINLDRVSTRLERKSIDAIATGL